MMSDRQLLASVQIRTHNMGLSSCNRELALRHSPNSSAPPSPRMDRLLGARIDGSAVIVTSLGRARARGRARTMRNARCAYIE